MPNLKIAPTSETKPHASTPFRSRGPNPYAPKDVENAKGKQPDFPQKQVQGPESQLATPILQQLDNLPENERETLQKKAAKKSTGLHSFKSLLNAGTHLPENENAIPERAAELTTLSDIEKQTETEKFPSENPETEPPVDAVNPEPVSAASKVEQVNVAEKVLAETPEQTEVSEAPNEKAPEKKLTSPKETTPQIPEQLAPAETENKPEAVTENKTSTQQAPQQKQEKKEEANEEEPKKDKKEEKDAGPAPVEVNFENPPPVQDIRMDPAADKAGQLIPPDEAANNNVLGLVIVAQQFRDQGKEARDRSLEQTAIRNGIEGQLAHVEKEVKKSDTGLKTAQKNTEFRAKKLKQADKPLATSEKRQQKTGAGVGAYISKYDENKGTAKDLNKDSAGLLGGSQKHEDPEDSDSGELTGNFEELSSGTDTMAQAMSGAGSKANKLAGDSKTAGVKNTKSSHQLSAAKETVKKSETKIKSEQDRNKRAHGELRQAKPKLAESKRTEEKLKAEGESLMTTSFAIENETQRAQYFYYSDMSRVPGEEELYLEEEHKFEKKLDQRHDGEALVFKYARLKSESEKAEFVEKLDEKQRLQLGQELEKFTANYDSWVEEKQNFFLSSLQKKRGDQIDANNNKRNVALQSPLDRVTANLDKVSKTGLFWSSLTHSLGELWNSLTSITWADVGTLGLAMVNPLETFRTISDNLSGIWTDLSDWGGFSKDPVGMILQKGSSVAVKLATISGVITGLLLVLTIAAGIGTIFTGGALLGLTIWLADATALMGTITFWIGLVAAALSFLSGMKNIYDLHTAKTADVLFQETAALKKDAANTGSGILAMIGGKASVKGAQEFKTAFTRSPKAFLKQKFLAPPLALIRKVASVPRRVGSLFRKDTWTDLLKNFRKYLSDKTSKIFNPKKQKFSETDGDFQRYAKYEDQVDGSSKERMYDKAKREVGDGPNSGGKSRTLVLARIIAEANDRINTPVSILMAELAPLKAVKGVTGFGYKEEVPGSGNFKIFMFGSKYDVDKNYSVAKKSKWVTPSQNTDGPGLRDHFNKHGEDLGFTSTKNYDISARNTIKNGRKFKYKDRSSGETRVGYWDEKTGLFTATSQTRKTPIILTHFQESWQNLRKLPGFTVLK